MRDLANLFKALCDESRLRILNLLVHTGELCVCDMQRILKFSQFSQPKVSRHLTYLKNSGLVVDERKGMWVIYSLANAEDETTKRLMKELKDIFDLNPNLKEDLMQLKRAIKDGTCTTYCVIYPAKSNRRKQ
jgi:ArsR family transcriptional regulator